MTLLLAACCSLVANLAVAAAPDYSAWTALLQRYYHPARGMDYAALKARDAATLQRLRQKLGSVDPQSLDRKQQLAYWINVYNVNTAATVVESYPIRSIRELSTDPIVRRNVFKKPRVPNRGALISLDEVENDRIRGASHDPRIHFAINCAARSCPPMRSEAFTGDRVEAQLDDQVRRFLAPARLVREGDTLVIHASRIIDWFHDDFERWGGGTVQFIRRYAGADQRRLIDGAGGKVRFDYDDYDWTLNDWKR
jgi:hypothetical protein